MSRRTDPARHLTDDLREARRLHTALGTCLARLENRLSKPLEGAVEHPVRARVQDADPTAEHRRQHRPGFPARIDADPELSVFILARIDTMTFHQLQDTVAAAFPPHRRIRKTAIHRWWTRNRPQSHPA